MSTNHINKVSSRPSRRAEVQSEEKLQIRESVLGVALLTN
jgi:hypothetical protein